MDRAREQDGQLRLSSVLSNLTMNNNSEVQVPVYENIVITMILLFALFANGLLIFLFLRDHRMHTTTNFFVMSHILSEFCASCQGLVISIYMLSKNGRPVFTLEAYVFVGCENVFFFYTSFLSLTAIAVNRYLAVVKKVHHKLAASKAKVIICILWVLSLFASLPYDSIFSGRLVSESRFLAWLVYCQRSPAIFKQDNSKPAAMLSIFFAVVCIGVPILILLGCFYFILKSAFRNRRQVSVSYNMHRVAADAYARSAFTTLLIIAVYLICNAFILPLMLWPSTADSKVASFIYRSIIWLRSATYPVVYILRNPVYFRVLRRKIFQISTYFCQYCRCCFKDDRTPYTRPQSPAIVGRTTSMGCVAIEMQQGKIRTGQSSSRDSPLPHAASQPIRPWYLYKPKVAFTDLGDSKCRDTTQKPKTNE